MWKIFLAAPQYPEGLEMHIWINKIGGNNEFVLQNFNILNHYIGMAPIKEDSFKELTFMPYIAIFFLVTGLLTVLLNRKKIVFAWTLLLMIAATAGLVDFKLWLTEFGTNLDPQAPIKVPGMTYIPPFLGTKNLLNFEALSLPWVGGLGLLIPILSGLIVLYLERNKNKKEMTKKLDINTSFKSAAIFILPVLIFFSSCSTEPKKISYGEDPCHFCKMTITEDRYGAQLVTSKGKSYLFDSIECLGRFMNEGDSDFEGANLLVTDYAGKQFTNASEAIYLRSENLPSPMGMNLTAFASQPEVKDAQNQKGGDILSWDQVLELTN